ncbi:receptor-like serine/threonine-protein kinase SD1-8 [Iris pallida]|uniref:Receptor-like serine/threonine-protein kinase n=1 Tax=Iris pallida TaxID=29817 RepID=A0AAX6H7A2_IRIPA|nr:receptor-like serine/threonine-protein kinase SD1-8 [Iris pallida]
MIQIRSSCPVLLLVLVMTLFSHSLPPATARDTVTPTQPLLDNQTLISSGGRFALGFFSPAAGSASRYVGIWYNNMSARRVVWVANRARPVPGPTGLLSVTANGTMVITDAESNSTVWSMAGRTTAPAVAQLLDNGNFVIRGSAAAEGNYAWQSFEHPTDTMLAGMQLGLNWTTGLSLNLTSWRNADDPAVGEYYMSMDTDTVIYLSSSSSGKVWRSGPADGSSFRSAGLNYHYVDNSRETALTFQDGDRPMLLVASPAGKAQLLAWLSESDRWDVVWEQPATQCDRIGHCGHGGICDAGTSPVCGCLPGYVPKNPDEWSSGDWSGGCVRETAPDCRNGTDGFAVVSQVKLPRLPTLQRATGFNLDQCRLTCSNNCSCTAYAINGGEYGCNIWVTDLLFDVVHIDGFDQDLYLRVPSSYLVSPSQLHKNKHKMVAITVSLVLGAVLVSACVACFIWKIKTRKKGKTNIFYNLITIRYILHLYITMFSVVVSGATNFSNAELKGINEELGVPLFDFRTIEAATNYFSAENELGQGGFGTVYKGKLVDDQDIAVKRLAKTSLQGAHEFKNEVKLIAQLQNINLVQLLGCCIEGEERMLIYEYMANKSLDAFLFDKEKSALLDWQTRYRIIVGIARGLLYLHQDSLFRIIHRDLKASNILLDNRMNPKISDFGIARLFGGDETDFSTKKIVGTYGYMSPEYAMEGIFSVKSDVFSFGVLILEIVSGKKNTRAPDASASYQNLVAKAWSLWTEGESSKLVDTSMNKIFPEDEVLRCIKVGLLCVQERPEDRPLMSSVIVMLGADFTSLPEPKQPGFAARTGVLYELDDFSNTREDLSASTGFTSNDFSITQDG